jgi:predicted metal-binding membrane protein
MGLPMLILPFMLIFRWLVHRDALLVPSALLLLIWVVLPEAALLVGALPFFRRDASAQPGQAAASL